MLLDEATTSNGPITACLPGEHGHVTSSVCERHVSSGRGWSRQEASNKGSSCTTLHHPGSV